MADAREEAARMREEARAQGAAIIAQMRQQAQDEAERISASAHNADRGRAPAGADLAARRGRAAWRPTLACRIVGESLDDPARQSRVVERFLADLEA